MNRQKLLTISIITFGSILIFQLALVWQNRETFLSRSNFKPRAFAVWAYKANSLGEARNIAQQVVLGQVTDVGATQDLIVSMPGEPNNEDRTPIELVTIKIEKSYLGNLAVGSTLQLLHYKYVLEPKEPTSDKKSKPTDPLKDAPPQDLPESDRLPQPQIHEDVEDDPVYKRGEKYLLFLIDGRKVGDSPTKIVFAPEGRYQLKNKKLQPVTKRGFANQLKAKTLKHFEKEFTRLDTDEDGVLDAQDNCPMWPNPKQTLPSWPIAAVDPDCDGFSNRVDHFTGKLLLTACPKTPIPNDEVYDAWPPDLNDDQKVDSRDEKIIEPFLGSKLVTDSQTDPTDKNKNYAPRMDLNADYKVDTNDVGIIKSFLGKSCSPVFRK